MTKHFASLHRALSAGTRIWWAPILAATLACAVPQDQEVQMGRDYAAQIDAQLPIVKDPAVARYITDLGLVLARQTTRADLGWRFSVVNAAEVNAFALPGGFIYLNRGLIERAERLDQLAGVLGHEIGHVVQRHSVEQMKKATGANVGITILCAVTSLCSSTVGQIAINVGGSLLFAKYSRADEIEADSEAVANVVRAGIHPQGIPDMFAILMRERASAPTALDVFFASHPVEQTRIDHTAALVRSIPDDRLSSLVRDDANYQRFRAAVMALPPPPPPRQLPPPG